MDLKAEYERCLKRFQTASQAARNSRPADYCSPTIGAEVRKRWREETQEGREYHESLALSAKAKRLYQESWCAKRVNKDYYTAAREVNRRPPTEYSSLSATFTIATSDVDRNGNELVIPGVSVENYKKNPVVFFDHGMGDIPFPIGKCENEWGELALEMEADNISATVYFSQTTIEARQIYELIEEGILNAASIQVLPKVVYPRWNHILSIEPDGMKIEKSELLAWSIVGIPENPSALRKVMDRGYLAGERILPSIAKSLSNRSMMKNFGGGK